MMENSTYHVGEPHATWLRQLFPGEYAILKRFAQKLVNDEHEAEEIVSQAICKLGLQMAKEPGKLTSYSEVRAYLYATVRNACYDYLRNRKEIDVDDPGIALSLSDQGRLIHELELGDLRRKLLLLIDKLPAQQKQVAILCFVKGATLEEASEALHLDRAVISVYKNRAYNSLKAMAVDKDQPISPGEALLILWWLSTHL